MPLRRGSTFEQYCDDKQKRKKNNNKYSGRE